MPKGIANEFKAKERVVENEFAGVVSLPNETQDEAEERVKRAKAKKEKKEAEEKQKAEEKRLRKEQDEANRAENERKRLEKAKAKEGALLKKFSSGDLLGNDLKAWCAEQGELLPSPYALLYSMLKEKERPTPDLTCGWAKSEKWGSALLSIVEDDTPAMVGLMHAIQHHCNDLGFPKVDGSSVFVSLAKALYKHDLADAEAQLLYKDDEDESMKEGKTKAYFQASQWFAWLDESDDESSEEESDEDE